MDKLLNTTQCRIHLRESVITWTTLQSRYKLKVSLINILCVNTFYLVSYDTVYYFSVIIIYITIVETVLNCFYYFHNHNMV
jgi:hypothetical protein